MHPMNAELRRKQEFAKPIEIGSDVWVGGGAIICPGVRIGSRSVIGAGSVVTRDIPEASSPPAIPAGSSARSPNDVGPRRGAAREWRKSGGATVAAPGTA